MSRELAKAVVAKLQGRKCTDCNHVHTLLSTDDTNDAYALTARVHCLRHSKKLFSIAIPSGASIVQVTNKHPKALDICEEFEEGLLYEQTS